MKTPRRPCLLMISQVYVPDCAAVGQYLSEVAEEMARSGWDVHVLTASRGYSDPTLIFPRCEIRNGVLIHRLPFSSFGKRSILVRLFAQAIFMIQAIFHALLIRRLTAIVVSTSPPFAGFGGALIGALRRAPFLWWVMDLNPDQMIAAGKLKPRSIAVQAFDLMNRVTLRRAAKVITLDGFMAERLNRKVDVSAKLRVLPLWPHMEQPPLDDKAVSECTRGGVSFRERHGLADCFVIMYSGNHALQHPLETLLEAASRLQDQPSLKFVFIGDGAGKVGVDLRIVDGATNLLSLPYQPLETLEQSLSAADVHVVSMGPDVVGIVHPCKIYGAMAAARPILFFGPRRSHAGDLVEPQRIGWRVEHGDVAAAVAAIKEAIELSKPVREEMGLRAASLVAASFSRCHLMQEVCNTVKHLHG